MRVLVACEFSGRVRDAFAARGHDAWSCDLLPSDRGGQHFEEDIRDVLSSPTLRWDLMIAHPDCTYLCSSGLHWNTRRPDRQKKTDAALDFVRMLLDQPIERIALENPIGCIGTKIRPADQIIHPWQFGADASKATCLWLKSLPMLVPTQIIEPRIVGGRRRWSNQTDSGQNRLGPSADRWKLRAETYEGIAAAMAAQWG